MVPGPSEPRLIAARIWSRNHCARASECPNSPLILCSTNSSTFCRAAAGRFGAERMRLRTFVEGPTLLSWLNNTQAVLRHTPSAAACLAAVSHPAAINASRISASFETCLAFASKRRSASSSRIALFCPILPPSSISLDRHGQ